MAGQEHERKRSALDGLSTSAEGQQRGQRISLSEARRMALQTLTDTERRLQEARAAEAYLMLSPWVEDEDINT